MFNRILELLFRAFDNDTLAKEIEIADRHAIAPWTVLQEKMNSTRNYCFALMNSRLRALFFHFLILSRSQ
jgi:hypothetical protein